MIKAITAAATEINTERQNIIVFGRWDPGRFVYVSIFSVGTNLWFCNMLQTYLTSVPVQNSSVMQWIRAVKYNASFIPACHFVGLPVVWD